MINNHIVNKQLIIKLKTQLQMEQLSGIAKYKEELAATVTAVSRPGFGILAADESTGTIGQRF